MKIANLSVRYFAAITDAIVLFRNTPPGHADCMNHTKPLPLGQHASYWYNWGNFSIMNQIWKEQINIYNQYLYDKYCDGDIIINNSSNNRMDCKSALRSSMLYVDVENITQSRIDGHSMPPEDCLHYCIPGPIDTWTMVMVQITQLFVSSNPLKALIYK